MMRRVDLLPARYAARKRERRVIALIAVGGLLVGGALGAWWYFLGDDVETNKQELAAVQAQNAQLQAQIGELARFVALETEVQTKRTALQTVMTGDIAWPSVLTEIAMVIPGEVWLETLSASAGQTEGFSQVGTETASVRVADTAPTGRVQFGGRATSMTGVARSASSPRHRRCFFGCLAELIHRACPRNHRSRDLYFR